MQMKTLMMTMGCAAMLCSFGCGEDEADLEFVYGKGQPGAGLAEGGEVRFERVKVPTAVAPGGAIVLAQTYFIEAATGDFPLPALGKCNKVWDPVNANRMWPQGLLTAKTYTDVGPTVTLNNGSKNIAFNRFTKTGTNTLPENVPSERKHDILYAGPGQTNTISPDDLQYGTTYQITYENAVKLHNASVFLPRDYTITSPKVGSEMVTFTKGMDAVFEFESLAPSADVVEHSPDRAFPFVILIEAGPNGLTHFTHVCLAAAGDGGRMVVPASVLDEASPNGVVLHGQLSHVLDEFKGRRFDILGVSCNLSPYEIK